MEGETQTLGEGASFAEIAAQEAAPAVSKETTPAAGSEAGETAATDGGEASKDPEVPAAFKDATPAEGDEDGKPDLSTDPDLEKHPILKAKMAEFVANKERGIAKFMEAEKAKTEELSTKLAEYQPMIDGFENFKSGPEAAWEELNDLEDALVRAYGARPGSGVAQGASDDGEPKSKYGLEFPTDDKVVDVVLSALDRKLDERLGPVAKHIESQQAREQGETKAVQALASLKTDLEVAADPWITKDMVSEAIAAYPSIPPEAAFKAKFAVEIGKYYAKHATNGKGAVRNLLTGTQGGRTAADLKPGASMLEIFQSEAVLG